MKKFPVALMELSQIYLDQFLLLGLKGAVKISWRSKTKFQEVIIYQKATSRAMKIIGNIMSNQMDKTKIMT